MFYSLVPKSELQIRTSKDMLDRTKPVKRLNHLLMCSTTTWVLDTGIFLSLILLFFNYMHDSPYNIKVVYYLICL
jgi:hypothetical protein